MNCPRCHASIHAGAAFCAACGQPVNAGTAPTLPTGGGAYAPPGASPGASAPSPYAPPGPPPPSSSPYAPPGSPPPSSSSPYAPPGSPPPPGPPPSSPYAPPGAGYAAPPGPPPPGAAPSPYAPPGGGYAPPGPPPSHLPGAPPPGFAPSVAVTGARTSGMAIAGFVLSFFCGLLGLIFSWLGYNECKQSNGTVSGEGLALAGIIISIVSMLIGIGMLAGR